MNKKAVDATLAELKEIKYPPSWKNAPLKEKQVDLSKPQFIREIADVMNAQEGDNLPVSKFTPGGISHWEELLMKKEDLLLMFLRG